MGFTYFIKECSVTTCPFFHYSDNKYSCFLAIINGYTIDLTKKKDCIDKAPPEQCPLFEYGKSGIITRLDSSINRRQVCRG